MKSDMPIYKAVALDIAQRIINDEFSEGFKLSGRSLLSGKYNVSPETIRKSIVLLKEEHVVMVSQGKEAIVTSAENAYKFIENQKSSSSIDSLRREAEELLRRKKELDDSFEKVMQDIVNYADRFRNLTPYNPVEIEVLEHSPLIRQKISQIKLWQNTGATIVAIRRKDQIIISPGPDATILAADRLVVVGDSGVLHRTAQFINNQAKKKSSVHLVK